MREAKAIGFSVSSGILCDITAPMLYAEACAANLTGSVRPYCVNTFAEGICFLTSWNVYSHLVDQLHFAPACNNAFSGCSRVDKLGMNFLYFNS